jgi:rhodanese-related sulfurtransferase
LLRYLDVRDQAAFDAAHAPGAVRVPLDEMGCRRQDRRYRLYQD